MGCASAVDHQVKDCANKQVCRICAGAHLTCLHRSRDKTGTASQPQSSVAGQVTSQLSSQATPFTPSTLKPDEGTSSCTQVCAQPDQGGDSDHSMIIPVLVRSEDDLSAEFLEYAILDEQSNTSFVSRDLCERMNVKGPETQLLLSTMQEQNVCIASERISGLEVLDIDREHKVKLPVCFTCTSVPAKKSQIPKADVIRQWPHLATLAGKLMPYDPSLHISLLIGSNCPSIIRPREILAGGDDEPYAQKSLLGWGVIGNVCRDRSNRGQEPTTCNKVVASEHTAQPHFTFGTRVKEVLSPEKILKVLELDFAETKGGQPYSVEDERFLSILEEGIKKRPDDHYEMPLPLKSEAAVLPDNHELAEKRSKQLSARFKKNPKFHEDYKNFMKEVTSVCAEKVPADQLNKRDGKVNYIPHTGVYHPKKPDKIRVVFDCSAKYSGVSLNDYLLQGPDMMNGLLGILCRFRKEEVVFSLEVSNVCFTSSSLARSIATY